LFSLALAAKKHVYAYVGFSLSSAKQAAAFYDVLEETAVDARFKLVEEIAVCR
jgi:hypothetical protein